MKREHSEDYLRFFQFAKDWVKVKFAPFTIDDLREEYLLKYPAPASVKIYGAVLKDLSEAKLIKFNEKYVKSKAKGNRGRMVKQWISAVYSEMQSKKRISEETTKAREESKRQITIDL